MFATASRYIGTAVQARLQPDVVLIVLLIWGKLSFAIIYKGRSHCSLVTVCLFNWQFDNQA